MGAHGQGVGRGEACGGKRGARTRRAPERLPLSMTDRPWVSPAEMCVPPEGFWEDWTALATASLSVDMALTMVVSLSKSTTPAAVSSAQWARQSCVSQLRIHGTCMDIGRGSACAWRPSSGF